MATETNKKVRKGIKLYIDYFENEFAEISDEELGILIRSLYQYDQFQKTDEAYSEKINNDILLKTLFKILIKNNDRAVAEWNRKRKYFEEKDKDKDKDKNKDKNDLFSEIENDSFSFVKNNKLHNFNIFGVSISIEYENEVEFSNEDLEDEFSSVEEYVKYDEVLFKDIINKSFKLAVKDNFKKSLKDYCNLILEEY